MANKWNIPQAMEKRIRLRDKTCVYCGKRFAPNAKDRATWEHLDNDASNITELNVCLCCNSCNASKGAKRLDVWLRTDYCRNNSVRAATVATVVRRYLASKRIA